jgi:hypothetical protein
VLFLLAAALLAPAQTGFAYGRNGGNIMPFTVTIATTGAVKTSGPAPAHVSRLSKQQLANLNRIAYDVRFSTLPVVTACPNTLPDIAAQWIRVGGRTIRVHGTCLKGFDRMWTALSHAATTG